MTDATMKRIGQVLKSWETGGMNEKDMFRTLSLIRHFEQLPLVSLDETVAWAESVVK